VRPKTYVGVTEVTYYRWRDEYEGLIGGARLHNRTEFGMVRARATHYPSSMPLASALTPEEFTSLVNLGSGSSLGGPVPAEHLMTLIRPRYIEVVHGSHRVTITGRFRIASGS